MLGALAPPPQSSLKVAEPTEATGVPSLEFTNVVLPAVIDTMMPGSLPAMTAVNGFQQISTAGTIDNAFYAVLSKSAWMFDSDITSNILNVINGTQAVDYSVTAVQTARNLRVQVRERGLDFFSFFFIVLSRHRTMPSSSRAWDQRLLQGTLEIPLRACFRKPFIRAHQWV